MPRRRHSARRASKPSGHARRPPQQADEHAADTVEVGRPSRVHGLAGPHRVEALGQGLDGGAQGQHLGVDVGDEPDHGSRSVAGRNVVSAAERGMIPGQRTQASRAVRGTMPGMRVLLLGGTTEASALARRLAGTAGRPPDRVAGRRTSHPLPLPGEVRVGGLAGSPGWRAGSGTTGRTSWWTPPIPSPPRCPTTRRPPVRRPRCRACGSCGPNGPRCRATAGTGPRPSRRGGEAGGHGGAAGVRHHRADGAGAVHEARPGPGSCSARWSRPTRSPSPPPK